MPARVLRQLMRHADIKTTLRYYANVDAAVEEAVLGKRPNRLPNNALPPASTNDATTLSGQ